MGRIKMVAIGAIKQVCVLYAAVSFLDLDVIQAAVLVAVLLRVALLLWALRHGIIIDSEGVEYARLAQNLRAGRGYMGIFNNGIQLNFPPAGDKCRTGRPAGRTNVQACRADLQPESSVSRSCTGSVPPPPRSSIRLVLLRNHISYIFDEWCLLRD